MSQNKSIQLGLCCINTILRAQKPTIFASRSVILKTIETKGVDNLKDIIIQNLKDVLLMMDWNELHGIKVFRLSSNMFPHKSNPKVEDYALDFAFDLLSAIGEKSRTLNQRLTFHPGQYDVIGTPRHDVFQHTCRDLKYHADLLDLMELDKNSVIVIHGGGTYGDKEATKERWIKQFYMLPENVQSRIVLENCEKNFSIVDCLEISYRVNIPVVFDTHHFGCYKILHPHEKFYRPEYYIEGILETWYKREIKPKFHVSQQGSGKCGHHSDYVETIPRYLLEIPEKYETSIDIMIEAKMKEQAIFRLYEKYPGLDCKNINNNNNINNINNNKINNINNNKKILKNAPGMNWVKQHCKDCDCCK